MSLVIAAVSGVLLAWAPANACPRCRLAVRQGIHDENFASRLGVTVAPFAGIGAVGYGVYWVCRRRARHLEDGP